MSDEQKTNEDLQEQGKSKGVLAEFIEAIAQEMVNGKIPTALITVFDQEGTTSHTKFIHEDGNASAIAGELQRVSIEVLLRRKNITSE